MTPDPTPSPTPEGTERTDCGGGGLCQELGGMCDACAEESPGRCASILAGHICPDDLCRNASDQTLCGAWIEDRYIRPGADHDEDIWEDDDDE